MLKIKKSCKSRNKYSVAVAILRYIAVTLGERCGPSPVSFFSAAVDAIENDNFSTCEMTEAERRGIDCLLRVAQHSACDSDNDASGTCWKKNIEINDGLTALILAVAWVEFKDDIGRL